MQSEVVVGPLSSQPEVKRVRRNLDAAHKSSLIAIMLYVGSIVTEEDVCVIIMPFLLPPCDA